MKALKLLLKFLISCLFGVGIITVCAGFVLAYVCLWRLHIIQSILPKEQPLLPVTLQLYGPLYAVQGDRVYCHAVSTGNAGQVVWSIQPPNKAVLTQLPNDPSTAVFTSLEEGVFTITAAVAGPGNQAALDHIQIENVALKTEEELEPPPAPEPIVQQPVHAMQEPPPPTATEMTLGALAQVASAHKAAEARNVADSIYSVAKRLQSGLLPPNADIPLEIEQQIRYNMRERAEAWFPFTVAIDTIIEEYRRQGKVNSAASQAAVLLEIANTLATFR